MAWSRNALDVRIRGRSRWVVLVILLLSASGDVAAQCPVASVTVRGRVDASVGQHVEVHVDLVTPKGHFEKATFLEGSEFTVVVRFPTLKSYSMLWGHHCSNRPKTVLVTARTGDRILAAKELSFDRDFESTAPNEFRLRKELVLAVAQTLRTPNPSDRR